MSLIMKLNRNVYTGQCGGNHYTDSGELVSPNYPEPYTTNVSCIWTLTVQEKDTINLIFIEMDLEYNQDCVYDFVEVTMTKSMLMSCANPESFVRGGPNRITFLIFLVVKGIEDPNITINMPSNHGTDDGPTLHAGLVAL